MSQGRKSLGVALRLGVCALLLLWIFHVIFLNEGKLAYTKRGLSWDALARMEQWRAAWAYGPRELWNSLTTLSPVWGLASLVFMGATIFIGAFRWRMVLATQGLQLPLPRTNEISLVAHFFNSFLLGSTGGDLMKAYYAARETHHLKTEAVVTVFADRLIGLFSMLLFAAIMLVPNLGLFLKFKRLEALAGFDLAMLAAAGVLMYLAFYGGSSSRFPKARAWLSRLPKWDHIERSLVACRTFGRHPGFLLKTLSISMILNVFCVLQIMALAKGMGLTIHPMSLFAIVPIIITISALPITPSGLGVREGLYVTMLSVPGIDIEATQAFSLSLLAYGGSLFWSMVGGVLYATYKHQHHLDEVAAESRPQV